MMREAQKERVRILYRRAFKFTLNRAVHRHLFYKDASELRDKTHCLSRIFKLSQAPKMMLATQLGNLKLLMLAAHVCKPEALDAWKPEAHDACFQMTGGGLISGVALAAKAINPDIRVIAAEPKEADDATQSKADGMIITLPQLLKLPSSQAEPLALLLRFHVI